MTQSKKPSKQLEPALDSKVSEIISELLSFLYKTEKKISAAYQNKAYIKGDSEEPAVLTIKTPKSRKTVTIGTSHQAFFSSKS